MQQENQNELLHTLPTAIPTEKLIKMELRLRMKILSTHFKHYFLSQLEEEILFQ